VSQAISQQKQAARCAWLTLHPEDGGEVFLSNVSLSLNYMMLQPGRQTLQIFIFISCFLRSF
jgi:hypothetical protein